MYPKMSHVLFFCWCYHLTNVLIYPSSSLSSVVTFLALTFLLNEEHGFKRRKAGFNQDAIAQVNCIVQEQETQTEARTTNHIQTETESVISKSAQVQTETKEVKSTPTQVSDGVECASAGVQTELKDPEKTSKEVQTEQNALKPSALVQTEPIDPEMTSKEVQTEQNGLKTSALVQTESVILKGISTQTMTQCNAGETEKPKSSNFTIHDKVLENIPKPTITSNALTCDTKSIRDATYNPITSQLLQLTKHDDYLIKSTETLREKLSRLNLSTTSNASSDTEDSLDETNRLSTSQPLHQRDTLDACLMTSSKSVKEKLAPLNLPIVTPKASLRNTEDILDITNNPPSSQTLRTDSAKKAVSPSKLATWNFISLKTSSELAEEFSDLQQQLSINPLWRDSQSSLTDQSIEPNGQKKACKKSPNTWLKLKNQIKKIESPFRK